ncbi:uncharacterized protein LOC124809079 [Hydra vulgaris]|uniref:uncharacterized protein LOC124809079 n=1 Tax=Hydra vulgaris TaxID=6087 RepID=UPI001F5F8E78|nr:uncharacterized protein LOC105846616 [Hydra vulgaris]
MASRNERRKRSNKMETFISRLKDETVNYSTQFEADAEEQKLTINEDYFDESASTFFDDVMGKFDLVEDTSYESEVPLEDNDESNKKSKGDFSSLHTKLLYFCLLYKLSKSAILCLLTILNEEGVDVPISVYLFKKPQVATKVQVLKNSLSCGGNFGYLSIFENLSYCIKNSLVTFKTQYVNLKIKVGIDGIPIFKSSPVHIWPILFIMRNVGFNKPFPIAVYAGLSKPNFSGFIEKLHEELVLFKSYVNVSGFFIKITNVLFICDAPARSYCQCVKGHSGYNACPYCRIPGVYATNKVIFPYGGIYPSRTDCDYKSLSESNQLFLSPLTEVANLNCDFPPEYMHTVCLGVMRRLVVSYFSNKYGRLNCWVSENLKELLEERVKLWHSALPCEFHRKIRSFRNMHYFKATEFRTILLYTGPLLFKGIIPLKYYNHFLYLHFAMYVFIGTSHTHYYDNATSCIQHFLHNLKELFTESAYTFNAHMLSHLPEFVQELGPLDKFSAFPFENYLYLIKQRVKTGTYVFEQSINSVLTIRSLYSNQPQKDLVFSNKYPNNTALVVYNSNIVPIIITSVSDTYVASGSLLIFKSDLYDHPYPSSSIGIGRYIMSNIVVTDAKIINKCISFPDGNEYTVIPFANVFKS